MLTVAVVPATVVRTTTFGRVTRMKRRRRVSPGGALEAPALDPLFSCMSAVWFELSIECCERFDRSSEAQETDWVGVVVLLFLLFAKQAIQNCSYSISVADTGGTVEPNDKQTLEESACPPCQKCFIDAKTNYPCHTSPLSQEKHTNGFSGMQAGEPMA